MVDKTLVERLHDLLGSMWIGRDREVIGDAIVALTASQAAQQEPVLWLRTLHGEPDWAEDCVGVRRGEVLERGMYDAADGYDAIPLYAAPSPASQAAQQEPAPPAAAQDAALEERLRECLSVLRELRIRYHVNGRRPEECYEMSLIDAALAREQQEGR